MSSDWQRDAQIAVVTRQCPYGAYHGGCHYPDCLPACAGRLARAEEAARTQPPPEGSSRPDYSAVFTAAKEKNALIIWAIFEKPADFPEHFVLRAQLASGTGVDIWPAIWTADTLAKVRDLLPPVGLTCMPRRYGDPAHLIEVWI